MEFDKFNDFVHERYEGMWEIIEEGKLTDKAMKSLIKFSKSDNIINKSLQKRGMKQAKKHEAKHDAKLKKGLELIAETIANLIVINVEDHGGEVTSGEVKPNNNGTAIIISANYTECDEEKLKKAVGNYIDRCIERKQVLTYDINVNKNKINVKIKLFK